MHFGVSRSLFIYIPSSIFCHNLYPVYKDSIIVVVPSIQYANIFGHTFYQVYFCHNFFHINNDSVIVVEYAKIFVIISIKYIFVITSTHYIRI